MKKHTITLNDIAEYLRAGWDQAIAKPRDSEDQDVTGSLKGTFLMYLEDHGSDALLDFAEDYKARLTALHDHPATPVSIQTELGRQIVVTEVVIPHLRNLN